MVRLKEGGAPLFREGIPSMPSMPLFGEMWSPGISWGCLGAGALGQQAREWGCICDYSCVAVGITSGFLVPWL